MLSGCVSTAQPKNAMTNTTYRNINAEKIIPIMAHTLPALRLLNEAEVYRSGLIL